MSKELLDVYDDNLKHLGAVSRKEAHQKGYWHYTFHCWILLPTPSGYQILFQKRHPAKETNPGKLCTSAAGHILAGESAKDGVREIEEEIGIRLSFDEMNPIGEYKLIFETNSLFNREISLVYYTVQPLSLHQFTPQLSEVSGLFLLSIENFYAIMHQNIPYVDGFGYLITPDKKSELTQVLLCKDDFDTAGHAYYQFVSEYLFRQFCIQK